MHLRTAWKDINKPSPWLSGYADCSQSLRRGRYHGVIVFFRYVTVRNPQYQGARKMSNVCAEFIGPILQAG